MDNKAAQYLGLARKGGMLAVGEEGSGAVIAAGKGRLLMLAADASPNARKRAEGFLYGHRAPLQTLPWTKAELSAMMGKRGCSMLCFTDLPLAARFAAELAGEIPAWQETADLLAQREDKLKRRKAAPRKHTESGKRRK